VDHSVPVQVNAYLAVVGDSLLSLVDVEFQRASAVLQAILHGLVLVSEAVYSVRVPEILKYAGLSQPVHYGVELAESVQVVVCVL